MNFRNIFDYILHVDYMHLNLKCRLYLPNTRLYIDWKLNFAIGLLINQAVKWFLLYLPFVSGSSSPSTIDALFNHPIYFKWFDVSKPLLSQLPSNDRRICEKASFSVAICISWYESYVIQQYCSSFLTRFY